MTDGATRRIELMNRLKQENRPLSGTELAKEFGVSRQVIVQDIALLRATNRNILSTNKGYVLYDPEHGQNLCRRIFAVNHTDAQMQEELYLIVDCGGYVCDVIVEHETADLPLKVLTGNSHLHTVEADSEKILDEIETRLAEKGFLKNK